MTKEFEFFPPKSIGRHDRQEQMKWATAAADLTAVHPCVRIFKDVCLYSQKAMFERGAEQRPGLEWDYTAAPYWIIFEGERAGETIPMRSVEDIAGFFHYNKDYWQSVEK
jgi:hypothetical protein